MNKTETETATIQHISHHCRLCGDPEQAHYTESVRNRLTKEQLCFICDFWQEKVRWREEGNPNALVIEGGHYTINPDVKDGSWSGFGGREFIIEKDNQRIVTHNLWYQGQVPERFRGVLGDNARFVESEG